MTAPRESTMNDLTFGATLVTILLMLGTAVCTEALRAPSPHAASATIAPAIPALHVVNASSTKWPA
jgi:hypothetical protein